jgi:DNA-binding PadR family transcriptional regulator
MEPASVTPPPELTATGRVILGMLALGARTGYDIKQLVDKSTRFFWAASYGQIYPELRALERTGLVRGRPEPSGNRARTVFELTDAGQEALRGWLESPVEPVFELRCESMLKLFFSDAVDAQHRVENVRSFRVLQERKLAELRSIEAAASAGAPQGPRLTLQFGLAFAEWIVDWCLEAERRLGHGQG